jgi:hypothetical protein
MSVEYFVSMHSVQSAYIDNYHSAQDCQYYQLAASAAMSIVSSAVLSIHTTMRDVSGHCYLQFMLHERTC